MKKMVMRRRGIHREKEWKYETGGVKKIDGRTFSFRGWHSTKKQALKDAEKRRKHGSLARVYSANAPGFCKDIGYGRKQYGVWECPHGRR